MNEYIKNVRFAERNAWFDSCVYVRFLMNGPGSLKAFQYDQMRLCVGLEEKIQSMY